MVKTSQEIVQIAADLSHTFAERAAKHDAEGSFPYENYDDIRAAGYPKLSVPIEFGGWGANLLDCVKAQEILAMGDGSTALAIAMHVHVIGWAAQIEQWNGNLFAELCKDVVTRGALVNSCATEPEMGSPSRGGKPMTTAGRVGDNWIINGRKTYSSMAPALDYFIIPASVVGEDTVARFLVPRQDGVQIEDAWDSMGLRAIGNNDVILKDVCVPDRMRINTYAPSQPSQGKAVINAWSTLIFGAVYLGIGAAAHEAALKFAHERVPTTLGRPIATLESIQRRLGEGEMALQTARSVLYRAAEQWEQHPEDRDNQGESLIVAKIFATNQALAIVDAAMRAVGGASMTRSLPLERYYRDVRAGLYQPPHDDTAIPLLGRMALQRIAPLPKAP
ncbi:MAG: acyl-CoA/acyl-ACP dehydrogenase [Anaerolineae bacterium]|nr:acyl-CoA/acyl-ACP dehydrogenase [Anaerolineae bacterium]